MSKFVDYLVAFILCLLMVALSLGLRTKMKGFMLRILQVVFLYVAIRLGYELYVDHRIEIDFSTTFLMITFGFFAIDVWNGVEGLVEAISVQVKKIRDRVSSQEIIEKEF